MKTAVTYSVVKRRNPRNIMGLPKYYAQAQSRGEADTRSLAVRIQEMCTVTRADCMAVLVALETAVTECLSNGEIVRLGDLGSLQVSLSSTGAEKKEDFNASLISKSRILFRPGETLQGMQHTMKYERVEQRPLKGKKAEAGGADAQGDEVKG